MGLVAVSVAAWAYMLYDYVRMQTMPMSQMWMPPTGGGAWSLQDFWLTFVMWAVMMVAMMLPSAAPMVLMFATVNRKRRSQQRPYVPTFVFASGYVAVWILFSAVVTLVQWPLHHWALLTPMMDNASAIMAGLVLIIAGVYQWTPWKDACLNQCRTPLGFLMTEWREGAAGAFLMGVKHGFFCVGCCWALMLVLFAVGVMNMLWVRRHHAVRAGRKGVALASDDGSGRQRSDADGLGYSGLGRLTASSDALARKHGRLVAEASHRDRTVSSSPNRVAELARESPHNVTRTAALFATPPPAPRAPHSPRP